jgi:hypothetical protein
MAQANPFDQFDAKAAPRPAAELKPLIGIPEKAPEAKEPPSGYRVTASGNLEAIPGGPADPNRPGGAGPKTATELDLEAKKASEKKRGDTIRAIMGRVEDLYQADIAGQPLERLGGLTEYIGTLPKNERFNAAANSMLPLIRPLIAQTAKEGDSDKEMQVFMAYIPQASDADATIVEKLDMLKTLIGGMVDGKVPSETLATAAPVNPETAAQLQQMFEAGATAEQISQAAAQLNLSVPAEMLSAAINYRDAGGKGASLFPASQTPQAPAGPSPEMQALGAGVGDIVQGAGDILGLVGNPLNAVVNQALGTNLSTDLGSSLRSATGLPTGNETASAIIRGATGGLAGAGAAGLLARGTTGAVSSGLGQMAQAPLLQTAGGGGAALGAEMARDQGAGPVGQIGAALLGGVAGAGGAKAVGAALAPRVPVSSAVTAAKADNIPVMTSDIAPPETFIGKNMQALGERIPLTGTGAVRVAQQDARTNAVNRLLTDYGVGDEATTAKVTASLNQTRAAEVQKYTKMKDDVIAPLSSAGEVPIPNATKAIDDEIARLERLSPETFAPAISVLRRWRSDLTGKTLEDVETLRRQVGEEFSSEGMAAVKKEAQKSLNRIYGPLNEDMGQFIKANGAPRDYAKWRIANGRLSESISELKKSGLRRALRDGDVSPEVVESLLFSSKPSDVATLYRNLGPQGKAAARTAILDRVYRGMKDKGGGEVTPEKFLTEVRKQAGQVRIFFSKPEADRIEGLIKALELTNRAGQANVKTQTGQQAVVPTLATGVTSLISQLVGGDVTATAAGALLATGAVGGLTRVLENPSVGRALIQLRQASPKEEQAALKRLVAAINAVETEQ